MNILFLSMACIRSCKERGMYQDLIKEFLKNNHHVYVLSPAEKRKKINNGIIRENNCEFHIVNVGNITDTPFIEKGMSVVKIQNQIKGYIRRDLGSVKVDLFVVATPPVTFDSVVCYVKKKFDCKVYLLLKDFWPDSLLDINTPGGSIVKNIVYNYFRRHEIHLYSNSDSIGLMSKANVRFLLERNKYLDPRVAHINPNSIAPSEYRPLDEQERITIRQRYGIPTDKVVFIYGGTLGVGQNVPYIVECLKCCRHEDCHFVVSGKGVQYQYLKEYKENDNPENLTLINGLPKDEYDLLLQACDIGLIFLRYTALTPNYPSRLLAYTDLGKPVLCCTDQTTDIGKDVEDLGFGWSCLANNPHEFRKKIREALSCDLAQYGVQSRNYIENNATAARSYSIIMNSMGTKLDECVDN